MNDLPLNRTSRDYRRFSLARNGNERHLCRAGRFRAFARSMMCNLFAYGIRRHKRFRL